MQVPSQGKLALSAKTFNVCKAYSRPAQDSKDLTDNRASRGSLRTASPGQVAAGLVEGYWQ
eukprot:1151297-Amphidinium_carterae.1